MRAAALGLSVLLAGLTVAAPVVAQDEAEEYQVVYVTPDLSIPFWKYLSDGIHQEAEKVGATVTDLSSDLDPAVQLKNVQDSITKQVDLIILSPESSSSAPTVLQAAAEAGVPVVIADIGTDSGEYVSFIITNNYDGAKASAEGFAAALAANGCPNGPIVMFQINQARINGQNRTAGAMDVFDAAGVEVVQYLEAQTYTRDEGTKFAQDMLTAHPDLCGFWSQYDEGSLGAVNAIADAGKKGQVLVGGFDGIREVIDNIKAGNMVVASVQQPIGMGRESFKAGYEYLTGGMPPKQVDMPTLLVTADNVDEMMPQLEDTVFPPE